jgi:hypothetical protein
MSRDFIVPLPLIQLHVLSTILLIIHPVSESLCEIRFYS